METSKFITTGKRNLSLILMLGISIMLISGSALAQAPAKEKKNDKKIGQATLKEAKVTASILTRVEEIGPMKIRLNVINPTGKVVRIAIRNYQNEPVFKDSFTGKEYNKVLNLNSTESGRYALHVTGKKQTEVRRFKIESERKRDLTASALENKSSSDVMATIYKSSPTQIMLQVVNNTGKTVDYVFRNTANEVIHSGITRTKQFSKEFDMSEVIDGKYTIEVKYLTDKAATRTFDLQTVYERSFAWTDKRGNPLKPVNPPAIIKADNR